MGNLFEDPGKSAERKRNQARELEDDPELLEMLRETWRREYEGARRKGGEEQELKEMLEETARRNRTEKSPGEQDYDRRERSYARGRAKARRRGGVEGIGSYAFNLLTAPLTAIESVGERAGQTSGVDAGAERGYLDRIQDPFIEALMGEDLKPQRDKIWEDVRREVPGVESFAEGTIGQVPITGDLLRWLGDGSIVRGFTETFGDPVNFLGVAELRALGLVGKAAKLVGPAERGILTGGKGALSIGMKRGGKMGAKYAARGGIPTDVLFGKGVLEGQSKRHATEIARPGEMPFSRMKRAPKQTQGPRAQRLADELGRAEEAWAPRPGPEVEGEPFYKGRGESPGGLPDEFPPLNERGEALEPFVKAPRRTGGPAIPVEGAPEGAVIPSYGTTKGKYRGRQVIEGLEDVERGMARGIHEKGEEFAKVRKWLDEDIARERAANKMDDVIRPDVDDAPPRKARASELERGVKEAPETPVGEIGLEEPPSTSKYKNRTPLPGEKEIRKQLGQPPAPAPFVLPRGPAGATKPLPPPAHTPAAVKAQAAARVAEAEKHFGVVQATDEPIGAGALKGPVGKEGFAYHPQNAGVKFRYRYRVESLDDLTPSHTDLLSPNPKYKGELQPRNRGKAGTLAQIEKLHREFEPALLLEDTTALDKGPPMTGPDSLVESGSMRDLLLRKVRREDPGRWAQYQDALKTKVAEFGISPEELAKVKDPVLVRERLTAVDRKEFARIANEDPKLKMGPEEVAAVDAARMTDEALEGLDVGEDMTLADALKTKKGNQIAMDFLKVVPENERSAMVGGDKMLNPEGVRRLTAAVMSKVYPGPAGAKMVAAIVNTGDPVLKKVALGIEQSLPQMADTEALFRAGARDATLSISQDLPEAVNVLARLKREGQTVQQYFEQGTILAPELDEVQQAILGALEEMAGPKGSAKQVRDWLRRYSDEIQLLERKGQGSMFGGSSPADKLALLKKSWGC